MNYKNLYDWFYRDGRGNWHASFIMPRGTHMVGYNGKKRFEREITAVMSRTEFMKLSKTVKDAI